MSETTPNLGLTKIDAFTVDWTQTEHDNLDKIDANNPKHNFTATADPTSTNDSSEGYGVGSIWVNTSSKTSFQCMDATEGSAVWDNFTGDMTKAVYDADNDGIVDNTNLVRGKVPNISANTIPDLLAVDTAKFQSVNLLGYHSAGDGGGGVFYWDANEDKANHNGGTIIDPTKTFPSDWSDTAQQDSWFNTTNTGSGCWKRVYDGKVYVDWFGAKGDGTTDDSKALQKAIDIGKNITQSSLSIQYLVNKLIVKDKIDFVLDSLRIKGTSSDNIIEQQGTLKNVTYKNLEIEGTADSSTYQLAIGNYSGQYIYNFKIENCYIFNTNVGISWTAKTSGEVNGVWCINNKVENCFGVNSGQGYGILNGWGKNVNIIGNKINNCERHSIYSGGGEDIIISDNVITNHRINLTDTDIKCAIDVSRSKNIIVKGNIIQDFKGGAIYIAGEATTLDICENVLVENNTIINSHNIYHIIVGAQVETDYITKNITVKNNKMYQDINVSDINDFIIIYDGYRIDIVGNKFVLDNVNGNSILGIEIGHPSCVTNRNQLNKVICKRNIFDIAGIDRTNVRCIYLSVPVCETNIEVLVKENTFLNIIDDVNLDKYQTVSRAVTVSNPYLYFEETEPLSIYGISIFTGKFYPYGQIIKVTSPSALGYLGYVCIREGGYYPAWQSSASYNVGNRILPTSDNGYYYECTISGTSGSSEPTWTTTVGDTVTDGTVTWECKGTAALFKKFGQLV